MEYILLVEDNQQIMDLNEWLLTTNGYTVGKAYTIKEAEEKLHIKTPDAIIMDVMLPDGDGIDFCEKIQRKKRIPILFLTAKTSDKDIMEGYRRGGNDYITKPYELEMLLVRLKALLRITGADKQSDKTTDAKGRSKIMTFDPVLSIVKVGGEKIVLSAKEFGILYCLANNKGKSVSKETLLKEVWGLDKDTDTSILWSTMYRLKKKIAIYEDIFYIESDHSGYELVII